MTFEALGDSTKEIDIEEIESELARLWSTVSEDDDSGEAPAVLRARTLNLIVFAPDSERAEKARETISQVTSQVPCRVIIVEQDGADSSESQKDNRLRASVSARCAITGGNAPKVCGEEITIYAPEDSLPKVGGLVLSLLSSDLPVVLWTLGPPDLPRLHRSRIDELVDRMIIDSGEIPDPCPGLWRLAQDIHREPHQMALTDLTWGRLTPWRELIAQFFDSPGARNALGAIEEVEIDHRPLGGHAEALLLVAWLASRLGWQAVGETACQEGCVSSLQSANGSPISVTLREVEPDPSRPRRPRVSGQAQSPNLLSVSLRAGGDKGRTFRVRLAGEGDSRLAACTIENWSVKGEEDSQARNDAETSLERMLPFEAPGDARLLQADLELAEPDYVFEESLQTFARLVNPELDTPGKHHPRN